MDLSIGILTWNSRGMLKDLLDSLVEGAAGTEHEIIVVDNDSSDGAAEMVEKEYPHVKLVRNAENRGVAPARNQIGELARGRYVVFLDVDTLVKPGAMKTLMEEMDRHPEVAIGGPRLEYRDGSLQLSCRPFPGIMNIVVEGTFLRDYFPNSRLVTDYTMEKWDHAEIREVDWMYGACFIVRKEAWDRLKGFDEGFFYLYEDVDLCLRAKREGMKVLYIPTATVTHFLERERRSVFHSKISNHIRSILRYLYKKWTYRPGTAPAV